MRYIGLDAGSVSVKLVVFDENGAMMHSTYLRHRGKPLEVALELLKDLLEVKSEESGATTARPRGLRPWESVTHSLPLTLQSSRFSLSLTGSAGRLIGSVLGIEPVNEVVAHAYSTRRLYPHVRTIIELGGEDSKLIVLSEDSNSAKDFSMNSVCAAGTGSFLDQQAERLRLSIEEFSELSLRSKNPPRIAGRCSVFAKSDMIHLQQIATPVQDIVAGLCFAVARNFKGSISRGRQIIPPVCFQGGVAANSGMVRAFREVFGLQDLFVPEEHALMGAIGAALKDLESGSLHRFDLSLFESFIRSARPKGKGHLPLIREGDTFPGRHLKTGEESRVKSEKFKDETSSRLAPHSCRIRAFLGVDIGSISTNLAVIDEDCRLLAKRYLMTAGRPIEAVRRGLAEIGEEIGDKVEISGVGTTGSGRYMIADYIGADIVKNEITAQATAAAFIDRDVDTIFEIGGQDSKYISLRDGVIADFEMNKACAAGTGSFLEEQAEKLGISIKGEFQESAFSSSNPCRLGERCTVFMENSLMANLQRGTGKEDLLAGLAYSIVQNYINRVVCKRPVGRKIFFQGGVAFNKSVVAAFEKYLGKEITVPPNHDVTGAIGMALIAKKLMESRSGVTPPAESGVRSKESKEKDASRLTPHPMRSSHLTPHSSRLTKFKGFELSKIPYEISSFECKGCPNVCEINRVKVEGEKGYLFYGGRCEKYDVKRDRKARNMPDLLALRDEMLWKAHLKYRKELGVKGKESEDKGPKLTPHSSLLTPHSSRPKIGIPYVFYLHDFLPFWTTLLWELGFDVEVSPRTDRSIVDLGLESVLSETCFPVKVAHGHIRYFIDRGVDNIFLPSFVNLNNAGETFERGLACPYTQTIPYSAGVAFRKLHFLTPVIDLSRGSRFMEKELRRVLKRFGTRQRGLSAALKAAHKAQEEFVQGIKKEGEKVLSSLKDKAIVIVGRAYNSLDSGVNLNISKKLGDLGMQAIPADFLPLDPAGLSDAWPNMYWRAGQRMLSAARFIRSHPQLYALYIGNFSCGPDSFITKFFDIEMSGKPYLHIEIDAHSADAGVITRCEAFLDSISSIGIRGGGGVTLPVRESGVKRAGSPYSSPFTNSKRTIYIPLMSDHAHALAAAFEYCGVRAEVLPESSRETVDLGRKYVSGKECYPCAVTTGDMVGKVLEPGFEPEKSAFFMPSGSGPCRFGQYNIFHTLVMKELGLDNVPIFSPNQDVNFYEHLGIVGKDFSLRSWKGIIAVELLKKCLHETRPYEKEKGVADAVYDDYLKRVHLSISGSDGNIQSLLVRAKRDFENIPRYSGRKPLIGIVGEIFVRSNRFSNEDLVRKIEDLGGEVYLAPVEEWIHYVNYTALRRVLIKKDLSGIINLLLKGFFQKKVERSFGKHFAGFLKTLHEPHTGEVIDKAARYVHPSFEGEAILSVGKSIDLIQGGASGLVNAMPFGCMPGTIVTGLMRGLTMDYDIPCLSIPYDGSESVTSDIQLEAFMDQAKEQGKKQR
ncbi:MAG: acyl-CoA dehydratase activase [Candidatus Sulfobium sp.]